MHVARRRTGFLPDQLAEHRFQQRRIRQVLRLGETAQAEIAPGDFPLHTRQPAGGAETAHRLYHGIEQAQEQQAQVIGAGGVPARIGPRGMCGGGRRGPGQRLPKDPQQFPVAERAFVQLQPSVPR
jgi:hypothetical protein